MSLTADVDTEMGERRSLLTFRLLGPIEVRNAEGVRLALASRKARLLLAFLAARPGIAHSREQLATLLWSDRGDEQARASLRQALLALRSALGPAADCLKADAAGVRLDPGGIATDVADLLVSAQSSDRDLLARLPELYRGDLIAGETLREPVYEEWLSAERRRLRTIAADGLQKLGDQLAGGGEAASAVDVARRLVEIDPIREAGHRLLISALAASGDRTGALSHYAALRALLARELGVRPDPATEALVGGIRTGQSRDATTGTAGGRSLPGFPCSATVLVMPFEDADADAERYFADGLTEDVIDGLSAWRCMPVIGRATAMHIRETKTPPLKAAAELGASYVVSGSVRRGGGNIRIAVEMIDVASGSQVWNMRVERPLAELFAIQNELTQQVIAAIEPEIARAEMRRAAGKAATDLTAWDLIVRAKWAKTTSGPGYGTRQGNDEAMGYLERALALEPQSSQVLALLAECHWHAALLGWSDAPHQSLEKSLELARRAAETDGSNWLAYTYLGLLQLFELHEFPNAIANVERGVELNPSASLARHVQGCTLGYGGKPETALPQLDLALKLDPRYVLRTTILADKSLFYFLMGDLDAAIDSARRALAEQPGYVRAQQRLVAALSAAGRKAEAAAELDTLRRLQPDFGLAYIESTYPIVQSEDKSAFVEAFRSLGVA